jgi:hypothetical protein
LHQSASSEGKNQGIASAEKLHSKGMFYIDMKQIRDFIFEAQRFWSLLLYRI